ncbi:MAG: methyltransferase domain-containing protein [Lachnospiraceae bacterium]|nr:methyltransferase domain-containing protein [Lachnospiraceae bacterium]
MLTILLLVHNQKEQTIRAVEHLRDLAAGGEEFSLILADNASDDGLRDWAEKQEDFSYAYMDHGMEAWGSVLKQLLEAFSPDGDILLMQSRFFPAPGVLEKMRKTLYSSEQCGMAACLTTEAINGEQRPGEDVQSISEASAYMEMHEKDPDFRILGPHCGMYMIKEGLLGERVLIDPDIFSLTVLTTTFTLQLIRNGYHCLLCRSSVAFEEKWEYPEALDGMLGSGRDHELMKKRWGMHYFGMSANPWIRGLIDADEMAAVSVMELGCDCGATLLDIKNHFPNARTIGCDISEAAIEVAKSCTDQAFVADIEKEDMPVPEESLDYVIFADVLEHLRDPAKALRYVLKLLKPGGKLIASIPNVMHVSVMRQLLRGDFTYTETGLLDRTHIHLFTFNEIVKILKESGFEAEIVADRPIPLTDEDRRLIDGLMSLGGGAERFMFEAFQYHVRAKRP